MKVAADPRIDQISLAELFRWLKVTPGRQVEPLPRGLSNTNFRRHLTFCLQNAFNRTRITAFCLQNAARVRSRGRNRFPITRPPWLSVMK